MVGLNYCGSISSNDKPMKLHAPSAYFADDTLFRVWTRNQEKLQRGAQISRVPWLQEPAVREQANAVPPGAREHRHGEKIRFPGLVMIMNRGGVLAYSGESYHTTLGYS